MAGEAKERRNRGVFARGRHRLDVPDSPLQEKEQEQTLKRSIEYLHGPEEVNYEMDDLVVLVLMRNGESYIETFVEHYFSLGAKHIVFPHNGSTNGTVEALKGYDGVTVLRTGLPYQEYNVAMKRCTRQRFGRGRWPLSVDIDELFDYPYSDVVGLKALLGYLNENSYTAVVSHMLDMFPEGPLSEDDSPAGDGSLKETHRFYDISDVRAQGYGDTEDVGNELVNGKLEVLRDGVQWRLFGLHPLPTKHPLVFLDEKLRPMGLSDHWAGNTRVADFTGVLLHYKLSAGLYELARREVEERRYINRDGKYDKYLQVLEGAPSFSVKNDASRKLKSVNDLVGTRFVSVSRQYMRFVESVEQRDGPGPEENRPEDRLFEAFFSARAEVAAYGERVRDLEKRLAESEAAVRSARKQLEAIQSSRSWKALTALGRVKAGVRGVLGRPGTGLGEEITRPAAAPFPSRRTWREPCLEKSRVKRAQKEESAPSPVDDESVLSEVLPV